MGRGQKGMMIEMRSEIDQANQSWLRLRLESRELGLRPETRELEA